jgi:hypothetical protein
LETILTTVNGGEFSGCGDFEGDAIGFGQSREKSRRGACQNFAPRHNEGVKIQRLFSRPVFLASSGVSPENRKDAKRREGRKIGGSRRNEPSNGMKIARLK